MNNDAILKKFDLESNTRVWVGFPKKIINALTAVFSLFCIYLTLFSTLLPEKKLTMFMGFIIIIGFILYPGSKNSKKKNHLPWYDVLLMLLGSGAFLYFSFNAVSIIKESIRISDFDVYVGVVGILVVAELCRRCVGKPILYISGALLIYAFYNQFTHGATFSFALKNIIYRLFYTTNGVIGTPVNVCCTYIVLFIIFGSFLEKTGISEFFISCANKMAGWSSGGPAKVAVISSALCGMVSGSSVGNTVTTGSVTIPMMKKTGYSPEFSGAVESASSTGGQIMPPIMGAAAFLMAEYMGIPYSSVALKAILPAFLYFFGIFISVHLEAKKLGLNGISKDNLPSMKYILKNIYLILPLAVLVVLVSNGTKTMASAAAISIIIAVAVGFLRVLFESKSAKVSAVGTYKSAISALSGGAKGAVTVSVACAMAGVVAGSITVTGLASSIINLILRLSGNTTIIGLILTMICCIILGMGVPTTANYCIMAATCAPILIQLGFSQVSAHFFVFYFGIVADITPPVALAAYAGSAIAKSNPMKTGFLASKLAIAAFIVPYIFAYSPEMLFEGSTTVFSILQVSLSAVIGLFAVSVFLNGHLFKKVTLPFRLIMLAGGLCCMIPGLISDIIGLAVIILVSIIQYNKNIKKLEV